MFHISAQNIDRGYSLEPPHRGGSIEYPHSMFLSRNKKNNVYPSKPQFYCIKMGFKGVNIIEACLRGHPCRCSQLNTFILWCPIIMLEYNGGPYQTSPMQYTRYHVLARRSPYNTIDSKRISLKRRF